MLKYALTERERKFIISPDKVDVVGLAYRKITDHYILGTMIRFRMVTENNSTTYKMSKKASLNFPGEAQITTLYLTEQEYNLLNIFETVKVEKMRYLLPYANLVIAFDRYSNQPDELWIAEIEFTTTEEMEHFEMPIPYLQEVTAIDEFNGFELAKRFG